MNVRIGGGKNLLYFLIYFPIEFFWGCVFCFRFLKQWSIHDHSAFIICFSCMVTVHATWSSIYDLKNKEHFYARSMLQRCPVVCPSVLTCSKGGAFLWLHWGLKILHILIIRGQGWENENWCEILGIRLDWLYCWVASLLTGTHSLSLRTHHPSLSSSHVVSTICCFSWAPFVEFCLFC